jgi:hypothetical protein
MPPSPRRLIYNYDAWGVFLWVREVADIQKNVDLFAGSQVTTIMLCPNMGQSTVYPSKVSELCHWRAQAPAERAKFHHELGTLFAQASERIAGLWREQGIDAFGLLVRAVVASGREAFATIRMNDVHCLTAEDRRGPYTDAFYRDHPEYRLQSNGGLNYAVPEVRAHRLACFEELLRNYPFTGLELDFCRGAQFFPPDLPPDHPREGQHPLIFPRDFAEGSAPIMTEFVGEVRRMVDRVSRELGRKIELCVRVTSSLSGCRRVGLDPEEWHRRGYLDFLTVGRFLKLHYALPIVEYKQALPGLPVCSTLEYILGGSGAHGVYIYPRDGTAEAYRGAAAAHYAQGSDGIYLFNLYVTRGNGLDPSGKDWSHTEPVEVLREIGDPAKLEGTDKLYLVDTVYDLFDFRFVDAKEPLPAAVTPDAPLLAPMIVAERNAATRTCTLRVVTAKPEPGALIMVQVNGRLQGQARMATTPRLFSEPYDQDPPELGRCRDFTVRGADLRFGANEIAVLSSVPLTVTSIELAVTSY